MVVPQPAVEILGDGRGEIAGVRVDGDRTLTQRFLRFIAAERAADAHLVPGVGNAQAVGAEDIDAVGLADGADLARVVDRDLLGDDDDLFRSGLTRTSSATPSRTPAGGR